MDRFVEFLRRVAAEYNSPPPTPRDEIWGRVEASVFAGDASEHAAIGETGSSTIDEGAPDLEMDRFVEFLIGAAAGYNDPPPTPRDDMWGDIDSRVRDGSSDDVLAAAVSAYRTPPQTPREEMWGRIEAAWQMRRSAGAAAQEAGLEPLPTRPVPDLADPTPGSLKRDRRRVLMVTGLAVAASLVIGIAIGRSSAEQLRSDSPAASVAQGAGAESGPESIPPGPAGTAETHTAGELASARDAGAPGREALETAPPQGTRLAATERPRLDTATGRAGDVVSDRTSRRAVAVHYATVEHLGRAEALLTTFRTEPDAGNGQVSRWARELLAETRLLMDLPNGRDPGTTALLRELELVLASIAGLGEDAPSGERAFIADGLERQGTLPRLRAAMPRGPTGAGRVGT